METEKNNNRREEKENEVKRQRRIFLIFIAAFFVIALLYFTGVFRAIGIGTGASSSTSSTQQVDDNAYSDSDFSFEFMKPWERMDPTALEEIGNGFEIGVSRNDPDGLMGIKSQPISDADSDLKDIGETLDEIMDAKLDEFNSGGYEIVKVNGHEVLKYTYDFLSFEGAKVAQQQYIFIKDDYAYYIVFHSALDQFSELESEFDKIISTFELKE